MHVWGITIITSGGGRMTDGLKSSDQEAEIKGSVRSCQSLPETHLG